MRFKKQVGRLLLVIASLTIAFISFLLYQSTDDINANLDNIEAKLGRYYKPNKMGGFAVSVFNSDSIIYSKAIGYANVEDKIPYTQETQQYIASVSKTSIGIALLKAEELGLLSIDDPINRHLPFELNNPFFPEEQITIQQLATHTSSLDYNEPVVESLYIEEVSKEKSLNAFMIDYFVGSKYGEVKFTDNKPGAHWNYSNIGASLAAYIIERVSSKTYSEFTEEHIFTPLELNNTYWAESESDSLLHTSYYEPADESIVGVETSGIILYPNRDMITDLRDLTKYCQAIISRNPVLLKSSSFDKLLSPQLKGDVTNMEDDNNGLFFFIDRNNYGITYQLTGMDGGDNCITTMMLFDPTTELGYIFMGNTGKSELNRVNHILIYNALVSLGHNYSMNNSDLGGKVDHKCHNLYNRIMAFF